MSSAGGSRPAPGLLPETSVTDLEVAWKEREEEARELTVPGFHSMALSMRLYSLEIRLKTHICRLLKLSHLPRVCKTHDHSELIIFTGMWEELENPANGMLRRNWDLLPWHRRSSYEPDAPVLMLRYLGWLLETGIGENGETLHMG